MNICRKNCEKSYFLIKYRISAQNRIRPCEESRWKVCAVIYHGNICKTSSFITLIFNLPTQ